MKPTVSSPTFRRNKVAFCVGLIDSLSFDTLSKISNIRNLFAHTHPERTFEHQDIKPVCASLKFPQIAALNRFDGEKSTLETLTGQEASRNLSRDTQTPSFDSV